MNKVIVITGGTSGIGKYLVEQYIKLDNKVYIISKDSSKIEKVKKEINNENTIFIKADLTKDSDIKKAFKTISNKEKNIDLLINNAAYDKMQSIEDFEYNEFDKVVSTNLLGKMFCIKYALPLLKKSNYPSIINIASRLSEKPMIDSSAYCCAASSIVMLTKCAALELEKYKIRVNCISPSLTLTPLSIKSYTKEEINSTIDKSTRKRLCEPQDIFELIEFLHSKKSDYINGENIGLNGGLLLK